MGSVALVGVAVAGRGQAVRALLASVVVLLLVDPWLARSWGFALSVAATAGLVMMARRWSAALPGWMPEPVRDGVGVAVAAQVATLPLVVALSGQVALLSVVANLLATPAVAPATVLGAAAAARRLSHPRWLPGAPGWRSGRRRGSPWSPTGRRPHRSRRCPGRTVGRVPCSALDLIGGAVVGDPHRSSASVVASATAGGRRGAVGSTARGLPARSRSVAATGMGAGGLRRRAGRRPRGARGGEARRWWSMPDPTPRWSTGAWTGSVSSTCPCWC